MSAEDDIAKVRDAIEEHLDCDCYCPDRAAKAAILATLDLLREPTQEMIDCAWLHVGESFGEEDIARALRAAIDMKCGEISNSKISN